MTKMERWLAYFANKLSKEQKEELAMAEPAIKDAYDASNLFLNTPEEQLNYINREMAIMDYNSGIETATEKGREEGREEGRAEGEDRVVKLMAKLFAEGKQDEAKRATTDRVYRQKLFHEYGIE